MLKLTKQQVQEAITTIYGRLCEGASDADVMAEMGLAAEDYERLRVAMFDAKADNVRTKPTEHQYVEYLINQSQNIRDLTKVVGTFEITKQYNAIVGAIRARAEIYDKLIETGQRFGLIHKEADRKEIVAGVMVADMTNQQLKKLIVNELKELNGLMKRYGGDATIVDMDPGPLHLPEADGEHVPALAAGAELPSVFAPRYESKTVKARTARIHKGRKVVK